MTTLLLVRHGETDWNAERRWQGHADVPLNDRGREQARVLAEQLTGESIDALYADTLQLGEDINRMILGTERWEQLRESTRDMLRSEGAAFRADMTSQREPFLDLQLIRNGSLARPWAFFAPTCVLSRWDSELQFARRNGGGRGSRSRCTAIRR